MLHDDFYQDAVRLSKSMQEGIDEISLLAAMAPRGSGIDLGIQDARSIVEDVCEVCAEVTKSQPIPFYIDGIEFGPELLTTAIEFWKQDFLKLPFENVLLMFRHCSVTGRVIGTREVLEHHRMNDLVVHVRDLGDNAWDITLWCLDKEVVQSYGEDADLFLGGSSVGFLPTIRMIYHRKNKGVMKVILGGEPYKTQDTASFYYHLTLQAVMALGMPHFEKKESGPIPEKLNAARVKRGKPALRPYVTLSFNRKILDHLGGDGKGGWKVKPHWRRGHIRTLADGRRIPIPMCLVNFEGGELPEKKPYRLIGDKS